MTGRNASAESLGCSWKYVLFKLFVKDSMADFFLLDHMKVSKMSPIHMECTICFGAFDSVHGIIIQINSDEIQNSHFQHRAS